MHIVDGWRSQSSSSTQPLVTRHTGAGRRNVVSCTVEMSPDEFRAFVVRRGVESRIPRHVYERLVNTTTSGAAPPRSILLAVQDLVGCASIEPPDPDQQVLASLA